MENAEIANANLIEDDVRTGSDNNARRMNRLNDVISRNSGTSGKAVPEAMSGADGGQSAPEGIAAITEQGGNVTKEATDNSKKSTQIKVFGIRLIWIAVALAVATGIFFTVRYYVKRKKQTA